MAIFAPIMTSQNPVYMVASEKFQPPSSKHWFGTDSNGRDVFTRLLYGAAISMRAGILMATISLAIGVFLGSIAAKAGGSLDEVIMRFADVVQSIPQLLLGMIMVVLLGPSVNNAILAMALIRWPAFARLSRAEILTETPKPYVEAAKSMGASYLRIFFMHIGPNIFSPILLKATLDAGSGILMMASLSFIGLGASPPTPEWGAMVVAGRTYILYAPWIALFPVLQYLF